MTITDSQLEQDAADFRKEQSQPEFDFVRAFEIDEGTGGTTLKVSVTFATEDYSKPLDVSFFDAPHDQLVSVPFDLWARVVAAVQRASEQ